jgi:hypothetical protein
MIQCIRCFIARNPHNVNAIILLLAILAGLISGSYLSLLADPSVFSLMLTAAECRVSIVCILSASLFPVVFTAFAIYTSHIRLLFPIAFTKAFSFSFIGSGLLLTLGDSGWLMRALLMFSDLASLPVLCWMWLHTFANERTSNLLSTAITVLVVCMIGCLDYYYISPFLANLIS